MRLTNKCGVNWIIFAMEIARAFLGQRPTMSSRLASLRGFG